MKTTPRISVLMGIYNCADTLPEALDSLYAQTYKEFKLILCDDGSEDNTYEVAKSYAERYDNIVLLKNEQNIKLAATLNRCLEYADTEYIARMDGDDISLPTRFEKQIKFLDTHPEYAVVSAPMIHFDETGDWGEGKANPTPNKKSFRKGTPHTHAPSMVRTAVMKEVRGYTATKRTVRVEDYYLWYKIYKAGYKGYNLQEPLYKMRDDRDAMGRRTFKNRWNSLLIYTEVLRGFGFKSWPLYTIKSFFKIIGKSIIPVFIIEIIRKRKMSINK